MKRPSLTDFQKGMIAHAALYTATIALVGFLVLWAILALLVGTYVIVGRIGGWF